MIEYSIRSGWNVLRNSKPLVTWHRLVWRNNVPKHSFMMWLAILNKLPVKARLSKWKVVDEDKCILCGKHSETVSHLFFECTFSCEIWNRIMERCDVKRAPAKWSREVSWFQRKASGKSLLAKVRRYAFLAMVYFIWLERNAMIFQGISGLRTNVIRRITESVILSVFSSSSYRQSEWYERWL